MCCVSHTINLFDICNECVLCAWLSVCLRGFRMSESFLLYFNQPLCWLYVSMFLYIEYSVCIVLDCMCAYTYLHAFCIVVEVNHLAL